MNVVDTMKNQLLPIIFISLLFSILINSCSNKSATIKGDVKNAKGRTLYIEQLIISTRKVVDSTKLNDKGNFSFNYKFTKNEPTFVVLRADSVTLATLLIEEGEKVLYSGDFKQPSVYTVEGSQGSLWVKELNEGLMTLSHKIDSLARVLKKAENDNEYAKISEQVNYNMGALVVKHKQALIRFIINHPTSFASFVAIYQRLPAGVGFFGKTADMLYYKTLVDSLSAHYPNSVYVQVLNDDYKKIENAVAMQNLLDNASVSEGIPDVELLDVNGKKVKLSSLRGKVVLVDFWSAADKAMLMNNRELVDIYNKHRSRGFEVYQISEDKEDTAWLEAINNQQLTWVSVMDTPSSYAASLYNVTRLPANYLLNGSGEIIGKNLFGEALDKKLNEVLSRK